MVPCSEERGTEAQSTQPYILGQLAAQRVNLLQVGNEAGILHIEGLSGQLTWIFNEDFHF